MPVHTFPGPNKGTRALYRDGRIYSLLGNDLPTPKFDDKKKISQIEVNDSTNPATACLIENYNAIAKGAMQIKEEREDLDGPTWMEKPESEGPRCEPKTIICGPNQRKFNGKALLLGDGSSKNDVVPVEIEWAAGVRDLNQIYDDLLLDAIRKTWNDGLLAGTFKRKRRATSSPER